VALCAVLVGGIALSGALSAAAETTREEYVAQLERICKPGSEATRRAVRGVRGLVRSERLPVAAPKVAKAKKIFAGTVAAISTVPRPAAERATLARWFAGLKREAAALGETSAALRADEVPRFQRIWGDFIHEANKANNVVVSFGFNYCAFKASRFM
jgi:hypothetical protein